MIAAPVTPTSSSSSTHLAASPGCHAGTSGDESRTGEREDRRPLADGQRGGSKVSEQRACGSVKMIYPGKKRGKKKTTRYDKEGVRVPIRARERGG